MVPMCLNNVKSDTDRFSSPLPIIGLYIAGATLVCALLMLFDILSGLRRSVRYIPCRLFSLNSATLSLLGIASKLPVDLTTYMPSATDQLSKLTGTTMICIAMGFFMPSLGISSETERITNMIALSFLVVTVSVDICIQMSTKLIFSFVVEHGLILCFMLSLLAILWFCTVTEVNHVKERITETNQKCLKMCEATLMHRLKLWYMHSCLNNPQLTLSRGVCGAVVGPICVFCTVILSQAAFRSLVLNGLKFCGGVSDYEKWSMWMIIITQISITLIGGLAIAFRWLTLLGHLKSFMGPEIVNTYDELITQFSVMKIRSIQMSIMAVSRFLIKYGLALIFLLVIAIPFFINYMICLVFEKSSCASLCRSSQSSELITSWKKELKPLILIHENDDFLNRLTMACVKDMNKWVNNTVKRFSSLSSSYTVQMLSRHNPSSTQVLLNKIPKNGPDEDEEVTCLSMVLLVKTVVVSVPSHLSESLRRTLDEAFEIIYFIDKKINVSKVEYRTKRKIAKLLWKGGDIRLSKKDNHHVEQGAPVNHALSALLEAASQTHKAGWEVLTEMRKIEDFVQERNYTSIEELCDYIEQVFVEILHWYLQQLPNSIIKQVNEGTIEENEERARTVLKLLYKLDPLLEDKVQWIFPEGANITRFFDLHD